jgi:predicted ATPase
VIAAPPCPGSTRLDAERRHDVDAAVAEYDRLARVYPALGYAVILLPKVGVSERADFVLHELEASA